MSTPFPARLDHTAVAVANTEAAIAWYAEVLGFKTIVTKPPAAPQTQRIYLIAPVNSNGLPYGQMLEIMPQNESARRERHPTDSGLSHIAFYVPDFDAALAHLKAKKVHFLTEIVEAVGAGRLISFSDLDGNMLQIVERIER